MKKEHIELLDKLERYNPDEGEVALPFAVRLARENGWTHRFAERVLVEYKRFVFLAVTAGHPVTPSDEVDQAWHLHLTYTQSYWKRFCGDVIGQPLHHHPTKGGTGESEKFNDWYQKTLTSYHRIFGTLPPADIWPEPAIRFGTAIEFVRVNARRNWIIPRPRWFQQLATSSAVGLASIVSTGCVGTIGAMNIFDWKGPDFLMFYVLTCVPAFLAAWALRTRCSQPDGVIRPGDMPQDPYVIATLAGGGRAAFNAAVIALCERKMISLTEAGKITLHAVTVPPANLHLLEQKLIEIIRNGVGSDVKEICERFTSELRAMEEALQQRGYLMNGAAAKRAMVWPFLLALTVPVLGMIKVGVGVSRGKPVGFLVALLGISLLAAVVLFLRPPYLSRLGKKVVNKLRSDHIRLKTVPVKTGESGVSTLPLAVGLFGAGVLAQTPLAPLRKRLAPPANASGCGSSCGSGGCGGGGCGGGCGGCGGGD